MMKKGIDASTDLSRFANCCKEHGFDFVCRYYNKMNPMKNLTASEAHILTAAGLEIVAVWEDGLPVRNDYFSFQKGVHDGTCAYFHAQHHIEQPEQTPIYFAVDYDASTDDIKNHISGYFEGIAQAFNTISQNKPIYKVGVYGSGLTCGSLLEAKKAEFTWLAQSVDWRGSKTFGKYNLKQGSSKTICNDLHGGFTGDTNESPNNDEGAFTVVKK